MSATAPPQQNAEQNMATVTSVKVHEAKTKVAMQTTEGRKVAEAKTSTVHHHPKYIEMIKKALGANKDRKNLSKKDIFEYIMANFDVGQDSKKVQNSMNVALQRGVANGDLKQFKARGALDSFEIGDGGSKGVKPASAAKEEYHLRGVEEENQLQITVNATGNESEDVVDNENLALLRTTTDSFFVDYYNIVIESWARAVDETTIPLLMQQLGSSFCQEKNKEKIEKFRLAMLNRLLECCDLKFIIMKAKMIFYELIFDIPTTLDLEPGQTMSPAEIDADEEELWKKIAKLEEEIIMLRIQIKIVKTENDKAAICQELIDDLELEDCGTALDFKEG